MKKMLEISREERADILLSCEDFYPKARVLKKFNNQHEELLSLLSEKHTNEVWMIINSVTKALRYGREGSQMPFSRGIYTLSNKQFRGHMKLSHKRVIEALETLESNNYLVRYQGYNNLVERLFSRVIYTPKMLTMFDVKEVKLYGIERTIDEYAVVKNYDTGEITTNKRNLVGIKLIREQLERYNNFLNKQHIVINGKERNVCYKRIFADNTNGAGRFYTVDGFLNIEKCYRNDIKINNCAVTEIDLCHLHPRLYYTIKGIKVDDSFEPYYVSPVKYNVTDLKNWRSLCKLGLMCIMYAKQRNHATNALRAKIKGMFPTLEIKPTDCAKIITDLVERNIQISEYFFDKDGWKYLQNIDSRVVSHVTEVFTQKQKVCLPYHDSFIVCIDDRELLISVMKEAWVKVLGTSLNFKYDIEF